MPGSIFNDDTDNASIASSTSTHANASKIKVGVRIRPYNKKEIDDDTTETGLNINGNILSEKDTMLKHDKSMSKTRHSGKNYIYDHCFTEEYDNEQVYNHICKPLVDATIDGFNTTLFAYGQTSSGKTHTLMGNPTDPGLMIYAIQDTFDTLREREENENIKFFTKMSYVEIYNEQLRDLLAEAEGEHILIDTRSKGQARQSLVDIPVRLRHDKKQGWALEGNKEMIVTTPEECLSYIKDGEELKHFGITDMNDHSSRAHTVFRLNIEVKNSIQTTNSFLNLVDLAGSESQKKANTSGARLKEGININKSLLALGSVISALVDDKRHGSRHGSTHIPYRDSLLTKILESSLGGNSLTAIICALSPSIVNHKESLNTLKFASHAGKIVNKPKPNKIDADDSQIEKYQEELSHLKEQMRKIKVTEELKSLQTMDHLQDLLDLSKDIIAMDNSSTNSVLQTLLDAVSGKIEWSTAKSQITDLKKATGKSRRLSALGMANLSAIATMSNGGDRRSSSIRRKSKEDEIIIDDSSSSSYIKAHGKTHYPFSSGRQKLEHPLVKSHQSNYIPSYLKDENGDIPDEYINDDYIDNGLSVKDRPPPPVNQKALENIERVFNNIANLVYHAEAHKQSPDTALISISELKLLQSNAANALRAMSEWEDEVQGTSNEFKGNSMNDDKEPLNKRYSIIGGVGTTSKKKGKEKGKEKVLKKKINKRLSMLKVRAIQGEVLEIEDISEDEDSDIREHGIAKMEEYIWRSHCDQVQIEGKECKEADLTGSEKTVRDLYVAMNIAKEQTDIMKNLSMSMVHEMSYSSDEPQTFTKEMIAKYETQAENLEKELNRQLAIPYRRLVVSTKPRRKEKPKQHLGTKSGT